MREVVVSSLTASQGPALEICKGAVRSRESAAPLHSPLGPLFSSVSQKGGEHEGGNQDCKTPLVSPSYYHFLRFLKA